MSLQTEEFTARKTTDIHTPLATVITTSLSSTEWLTVLVLAYWVERKTMARCSSQVTDTSLSDEMAVEVHGGDGFDCAISMVTEAEGYEYAWFAASQNGGLVRGTLGPGEVNNAGGFFDANFTDLFSDNGDLGQFYTCVRLYEDFDDEYSQNNVILVNTFGQDTTGGTFELATANQNLPFSYTMGENETLHFFDSIARPERILDAPLMEDPDYFWLTLKSPSKTFSVM